VVYDGAMGTNIQTRNPTLDDYWGKENCSEVLVLSRPDIIREIHADFFPSGLRHCRDQYVWRIADRAGRV
jgi:5-methyltetrahydrofolate--homocysteine methyltransferase